MRSYHFVYCLVFFVAWPHLYGQAAPPLGYDLESPTLVTILPKQLDEISGLSISSCGQKILAVQDELGAYFQLDLSTGEVEAAVDFWKDGDYEGIEMVGPDIWVVKNTGTLYQISKPGTAEQTVTKFNGFLGSDNDVEGLAFDKLNNRLLLACKSHVAGTIEVRSVFAFDLATQTFAPRPVFSIGRFAMRAYLDQCPKSRKHDKITSFINDREQYELGPSAIAIHPQTGQIFITSSAGKLFIILSAEGKIQHVRRLEKDFFPQPEGLAFEADGTLLVSTEAKKGAPARIYRLPYQPTYNDL